MKSDLVNFPNVVAEVREAFHAYEAALMRNDVPALNAFFWDDPQALRYGIAEQNLGIAAIRHWRESAPAIPATRRLRNTQITAFGADAASVATEFVADDMPAIGRQTQMWIRFDAGWRIVAAHVSMVEAAGIPP